jgi:hypothetical protein
VRPRSVEVVDTPSLGERYRAPDSGRSRAAPEAGSTGVMERCPSYHGGTAPQASGRYARLTARAVRLGGRHPWPTHLGRDAGLTVPLRNETALARRRVLLRASGSAELIPPQSTIRAHRRCGGRLSGGCASRSSPSPRRSSNRRGASRRYQTLDVEADACPPVRHAIAVGVGAVVADE